MNGIANIILISYQTSLAEEYKMHLICVVENEIEEAHCEHAP